MPALKIREVRSPARLAPYLQRTPSGEDRALAFASSTGADNAPSAEEALQKVRQSYGQEKGVQEWQAYIGFHRRDLGDLRGPDGEPDYRRMVAYGEAWAERSGIAAKYDYYIVAHDKPGGQPHVHVVWNSVGYEDGRKFHYRQVSDWDRYADINDQLGREHHIRRELSRTREADRPNSAVVKAYERGAPAYSWKADLQQRIRTESSFAYSEQDFIKRMADKGVDTRVRGSGYSFGFVDRGGKRRLVRASRLGEGYSRGDLLRKFEDHEILLDRPGGYKDLARRSAKQNTGAPWQSELREKLWQAERRATSIEAYRQALARKGITLHGAPEGKLGYSFKDASGVRHERVPGETLSKNHSAQHLESRFGENAFRKHVLTAISRASQKAEDLSGFRRRLEEHGVAVETCAGRFLYTAPHGGRPRSVEGEALSPRFATARVAMLFAENREKRELYQFLARTRLASGSKEEYFRQLALQGIAYTPKGQGLAEVTFRGHTYLARDFGKMSPERALRGWQPNLPRIAAAEAAGLMKRLAPEILENSREGGHPQDGLDASRKRRRRQARPGIPPREFAELEAP